MFAAWRSDAGGAQVERGTTHGWQRPCLESCCRGEFCWVTELVTLTPLASVFLLEHCVVTPIPRRLFCTSVAAVVLEGPDRVPMDGVTQLVA